MKSPQGEPQRLRLWLPRALGRVGTCLPLWTNSQGRPPLNSVPGAQVEEEETAVERALDLESHLVANGLKW